MSSGMDPLDRVSILVFISHLLIDVSTKGLLESTRGHSLWILQDDTHSPCLVHHNPERTVRTDHLNLL